MAKEVKKLCQVCGKEFFARRDAKTCSPTCRKRLERTQKLRFIDEARKVEAEARRIEAALKEELQKVASSLLPGGLALAGAAEAFDSSSEEELVGESLEEQTTQQQPEPTPIIPLVTSIKIQDRGTEAQPVSIRQAISSSAVPLAATDGDQDISGKSDLPAIQQPIEDPQPRTKRSLRALSWGLLALFLLLGSGLTASLLLGKNNQNGLKQLDNAQKQRIQSVIKQQAITNNSVTNQFQLKVGAINQEIKNLQVTVAKNDVAASTNPVTNNRLSSQVTLAGNAFNGPNELVQLTDTGQLPVLDGANLNDVNAITLGGNGPAYYTNATNLISGTLADARLSTNVALLNGINNFQPTADSTSAFSIQNSAASINLFNVDTTGSGKVSFGTSTSFNGIVTVGSLGSVGNNLVCLNSNNQLATCVGSGGSGVTDLDGMIGSLTVANSTGAGGVVTINNASTSQKGIAQFNGTDFSDNGAGTISTVQPIAITSTPTFGGLTLNGALSVTAGGANIAGGFTSTGGASISGGLNNNNGGITNAGTISGATGLNSSGNVALSGANITLSGIGGLGVVHSSAGGALSSSPIVNADLQAGSFTNVTGVGALTAGSIGGSFGNINIGTNSFTGNGSNLTNLSGANLTAGTVANGALTNSSLTVTAGTGLGGGGLVSLGGSTTLNVNYGATTGTAVQGSNTLNCTGVSGANLSGGGNSVTLGTSGSTCNAISLSATPSFTSATLGVAGPSGTTGAIIFNGKNNTNTLELQGPDTPVSGNFTLSLPAITGNDTVCTITTCTGTNSGSGNTNYIFNQTSQQASSNFNISGTGTIGNGLTVSAGGASITGGLNNNNGNITNAGTITGATGITSTGTIQGGVLNATTGFQVNGAATTGNYLRGNGTNFVSSGLLAGDITGTIFTLQGTTGTPQAVTTGGTVSILAGASNNLTAVASATNKLTVDIVSNPSFSGLVTASSSTTGLAITGTPTNSATSSLIQIGSAIASGNITANGGTYIGLNEPSSGPGSVADFLNFQVNGTSELKVTNGGAITAIGAVIASGFTSNGTGTAGAFVAKKPAANPAFQNFLLSGDANPSFSIVGSGQLNWGAGGVSATDTDLYRSASATLKTDGSFVVGSTIQGGVVNATTGFQVNGAATTGNYLRGNGTNFVSSALLATDVSGTLFTLQGSTGTPQAVISGGTVSILAGGSGNLTSVASATNTITVDIVNNPTFSGLVTASNTGGTALAVTGAPTNTATNSLIQIGSAIANGNTSTSGGTYIGLNAPSSGAGSAADLINLEVGGASKFRVDSSGDLSATGNIQLTTSSLNSGAFTKTFTAGTGGVTANDVVILANDGGNAHAIDTTTPMDTRVLGVSNATVLAGGTFAVKIAGNSQVTADTGAVAIGDQLVTSSTSGEVTTNNNATTGILGIATSVKAAGASGLVSVTIHPVNGQTNPTIPGNLTVQGTGSFTGAGGLSVTNSATIGNGLTVSAGGASISGGLNNNAGGITNAGTISGATGITSTGTIQGGVLNATTGFQISGAATTGNYLRGNGTNFVSSALLASDVSGTLFTLQGSTGTPQAVTSGGTVSILAGGSGNLTSVASATNTVTVDIVNNPTFSGLVTASNNSGSTALAVTGAPSNSATSSLIQIGSAIASGNTSTSGGTYIGLNAPSSGAGSAADLINLEAGGATRFKIDTFGNLSVSSNVSITTNSLTGGAFTKTFTAGTGGVSANDVVVLGNDGGNARAIDTTTARDPRVLGIASAAALATASVSVKIAGNAQVTADAGAVAIGDQLVTSSTSGQVTTDNSATTGILGIATSVKSAGASGLVSITIHPVNGQTNPNFSGNVTVQGTGSFTGSGGLSVTNSATIGTGLTVSAGGASISGGLNNNNGNITNAGTITGATGITSTGTIQGATLNATTGFQISGAATTGNYLRGNGTNFVSSGLLAGDITGTLFTLQGTTGTPQAVTTGGTVSILAGASGNLTAVASATNKLTVDIVSNPAFSGLVTASNTGATALAVTGAPTNSATSSLIQVGSAIASGNVTANGGTYLSINEPGSGAGSVADFLNFEANGLSEFKVTTGGAITGVTLTTSSIIKGTGVGTSPTFESLKPAANPVLQNFLVSGDANASFAMAGNGQLTWGTGGTSATDTDLYRSTTSTLKTDGSLVVGAALSSVGLNSGSGLIQGTGGLNITGGASISGGLNNNTGGITNAGAIAGATSIVNSGSYTQSGSSANTLTGATSISTTSSTALQVSNATTLAPLILADTTIPNLDTNGSFENSTVTATGYAVNRAGASISVDTTSKNAYIGNNTLKVVSVNTIPTVHTGVYYALTTSTFPAGTYNLSFFAKLPAGSSAFTGLDAGTSVDGTPTSETSCTLNSNTVATYWQRYSCTFTIGTTSGTPYFFIGQSDGGVAHTYYLDGIELETGSTVHNYREGRIQLNGEISSPTIFRPQSDSTSAFQVQNAGLTTTLLNIDTATTQVSVTGQLAVTGGFSLASLSIPAAPTAVATCTGTCTTSYSYAITALNANGGETPASSNGTTGATAAASLSGANFNTITWVQVPGASSYRVYRTVSGGVPTLGLIGTVPPGSTLSFTDTGMPSGVAAPTTDTSNAISSSGTNPLSLDTGGTAAINIGATNATSIILGGNSAATITNKVANSSTNAFQIQTQSGTAILTADTTSNNKLTVGTTGSSPTLLVLANKNTSGDPTEVDGAMYYNSNTGTFRCGESTAWVNCVGGLISSNLASSTAVNTCVGTGLTGCPAYGVTATIPANYCQPGRVVQIIATGIFSTDTGGTAQFGNGVYVAASTGGSSTNSAADTPFGTANSVKVGNNTNAGWGLNLYLICTGNSSGFGIWTAQGNSWIASGATTEANIPFSNTSTKLLAAAANNVIYIFPDFNASDAGSTAILSQLIVIGS